MSNTPTVLPFPDTRMPSHAVHAGDASLLAAVGAGPVDRVLVLGEGGADALSDALRRGCRGGSLHVTPPQHPDPVEVVVAASVRSEEAARAVADCARRALPEGGRLVLRLIGAGTAALARSLVARLREYGFERVQLRGQAEGALMTCRRPPNPARLVGSI